MDHDADLLREFVERGDTTALKTLVGRHVDAVYSAALRRVGGDTHLAEDVAQQVFIAMTRQARRLCEHPFLGAWLYRATRNQAANVVRSERRRKERERNAMESSDEAEIEWRVVGPVLDEAIDELREIDRNAVVLRYFERRTYAEIGAALQLGEDGARRRVERALQRLRGSLARREIKSSAAALAAALTAHSVTAAPAGLAADIGGTTAAITPVATAPGAAFLAFMATTKTSVLVGTAAILMTAALVTQPAWRERQEAQRSAAQVETALAATRQQRLALEERLRQAEAELDRLESAAANRARLNSAQIDRTLEEQQGDALLAKYPQLRDAFDSWVEARLESEWGPFLHGRGATPEQRAAFLRMMRDATALAIIDVDEGQWYSRFMSPHSEPFHAQVRAIFGEEGLRELRVYRQQQAARQVVAQAAGALALADEPLRDDQIRELVRMLAASGDGTSRLAAIDAAMLREKTRTLLSPRQRDWLEATFVRGKSLDEINRFREHAQKSGGGGQP